MELVFSDAHLTIAAAAGQDLDFGLPGVSSTPRIQAIWPLPPLLIHGRPYRMIVHSTWMSLA